MLNRLFKSVFSDHDLPEGVTEESVFNFAETFFSYEEAVLNELSDIINSAPKKWRDELRFYLLHGEASDEFFQVLDSGECPELAEAIQASKQRIEAAYKKADQVLDRMDPLDHD